MRFPAFTAHCPEGVLEMKLTVARCHTDSSGRMPPHVLAKVMEDAVKRQMEACGWGRETMETKNVALVVGWTSIQIKRLPCLGESLLARIWPGRKADGGRNSNAAGGGDPRRGGCPQPAQGVPHEAAQPSCADSTSP